MNNSDNEQLQDHESEHCENSLIENSSLFNNAPDTEIESSGIETFRDRDNNTDTVDTSGENTDYMPSSREQLPPSRVGRERRRPRHLQDYSLT